MANLSEEKKEQPIIIKKVKGGHGGHHGGAWKVAFADFVTAMMALFLIMWIMAQSDEVKQNVGGYFRDPVKFGKGVAGALPSEGGTRLKTGKNPEMRRKVEEHVKAALNQLGDNIRSLINTNKEFEKFSEQIAIEMTDEGLRIQLIESSNTPFFRRGSSELGQTAVSLVKMIGRQLGRMPNRAVIEGHTDAHQYADSARYTNWELSVDRANSARRVLLVGGLSERQIAEVRGFADRKPRIKLNPTDPRNRRITITALNDYEIYRYSDTLFVDFNYSQ
jgi:chemotaxis protein MotB